MGRQRRWLVIKFGNIGRLTAGKFAVQRNSGDNRKNLDVRNLTLGLYSSYFIAT